MLEKSKQKFVIRHYSENDYKAGGLRAAAEYRDLGVAEATNGQFTAHVARLAPGALKDKDPSRMHYHDVNFHMVYVLKGWMKAEFEGEGVHTMRAGSCWVQPSGIRHKVLAQSEDMELIEVISPGTFDTVNVE
jgi:quercetin dioxygenase-like cupin family protein